MQNSVRSARQPVWLILGGMGVVGSSLSENKKPQRFNLGLVGCCYWVSLAEYDPVESKHENAEAYLTLG